MKYIIMLLLLSLYSFVSASTSDITIAFDGNDVPVNAYIDIDAQYVAMPISLSSEEDSPKRRNRLLYQLQTEIVAAAKRNKSMTLQMGSVSLSPNETSSFSFSSSYSSSSEATLYLLTPLNNDSDIYGLTQKIINFVASIKKPEDTDVRLGNSSLAIKDPGDYRLKLLEQIKNEIAVTRKAMGDTYKVSISGLEGPVLVKQQSDRKVRLFINYHLKFRE